MPITKQQIEETLIANLPRFRAILYTRGCKNSDDIDDIIGDACIPILEKWYQCKDKPFQWMVTILLRTFTTKIFRDTHNPIVVYGVPSHQLEVRLTETPDYLKNIYVKEILTQIPLGTRLHLLRYANNERDRDSRGRVTKNERVRLNRAKGRAQTLLARKGIL